MREQITRSAHTRLNLVNYKQNILIIAELSDFLYILPVHRVYAALALYKLYHNRRRFVRHGVFYCFEIVRLYLYKARCERLIRLLIFRLTCCRNCRKRSAVEGMVKTYNLSLVYALFIIVDFRKLERALVSLRATVCEKRALSTGVLNKLLRQFSLIFYVVKARCVNNLVKLRL